jgi:transmembrane sensor
MNPRPADNDDAVIRATAARWIVRRDRGLSAAESIEFELWLAANPRHATAMQGSAAAWSRLDAVPELSAQRALADASRQRTRRHRFAIFSGFGAAAAAALLIFSYWLRPTETRAPAAALVAVGPRVVTLADGTLVRLNDQSEIVEQFTVAERRVRLTRGEAHFTVTKNPVRPFIVSAGTVWVRAVGTAFNVNLQSAKVEVLVTEGTVELAQSGSTGTGPAPRATHGQRAIFTNDLGAPPVTISQVEPAEMARALAWQDALLRLGGATLAEIAAEFERRSGNRVSIPDPALAQLRVGGRFRADDVEGFAKLLATTFDIDVDRATDGTLVLRKKNLTSR